MQNEWRGFVGGAWENEINVRDFIQKNYTPYDGDDSFLAGPTQDTSRFVAGVGAFQTGAGGWRRFGYGHRGYFHNYLARTGVFR